MSITTIVTLITSSAAFLTALAALWTVIELRSQKKQARKPEIVPRRQMVEQQRSDEFPARFRWTSSTKDEGSSEPAKTNYLVDLFNIGNGVATDVRIVWEYPVDALIEELNRALQQSLAGFSLKRHQVFVELEFKKGSPGLLLNPNANIESRCEYILPSSVANQPTPIPIPAIFQLLCSLATSLEGSENETFEQMLERVSSMGMRIRYKDLAGDPYENVFQCRLEYWMFSKKEFLGELTFEPLTAPTDK